MRATSINIENLRERGRVLSRNNLNLNKNHIIHDVSCREISIKEKQNSGLTKTFQFDRVFGINSQQMDVYRSEINNQVVNQSQPLFGEGGGGGGGRPGYGLLSRK